MAGLINPPVEAHACQMMIRHVEGQLRQVQRELSTVVLDREQYLVKVSRAITLEGVRADLEKIYAREFHK